MSKTNQPSTPRLGTRQRWYLSALAQNEKSSIRLVPPWGPVESRRVLESLIRAGLVVEVEEQMISSSTVTYALTPVGRSIGLHECQVYALPTIRRAALPSLWSSL